MFKKQRLTDDRELFSKILFAMKRLPKVRSCSFVTSVKIKNTLVSHQEVTQGNKFFFVVVKKILVVSKSSSGLKKLEKAILTHQSSTFSLFYFTLIISSLHSFIGG